MTSLLDVSATTMPTRFKQALLRVLDNIQELSVDGLQDVYLFGSLARSQITSQSDIDICVVFTDGVDFTTLRYASAKAQIDSGVDIDVDVIFCSETTFWTSQRRLFQHIRQDKVHLLTV